MSEMISLWLVILALVVLAVMAAALVRHPGPTDHHRHHSALDPAEVAHLIESGRNTRDQVTQAIEEEPASR
jgi:hypothetical protein